VAVPAHNPGGTVRQLPHASPSVRKFARELGVPLAEVKGSGPKGRITADDVQAFTKSVMAGAVQTLASRRCPGRAGGGGVGGLEVLPWPKVDFAKFGAVERKELSRIKKISGANLHRNWVMIPVTNNDEADITELEAFRVSTNAESAKARRRQGDHAGLRDQGRGGGAEEVPRVQRLAGRRQPGLQAVLHIGFAADTPNGLVVPVIKDADKKGICRSARKWRAGQEGPRRQAGRGRHARRLLLHLVAGRHWRHDFTPIINAPEVAILGVQGDEAGVGRQAVRAAPDAAAVAVVRPPRDRRRGRRALQRLPGRCWRTRRILL
jgi:pyruvate dehydrogenase E2 component (dihydrolipoamide acetyltransferase)